MKITSIRIYSSATPFALIQLAGIAICDTDTFKINLGEPAGREMYAAALAASLVGKQVRVELSNSLGCTGWGSMLQSVTVLTH